MKKPTEIAYFDRGPVSAERLVSGGSWSVYWYNGAIVSSEIARGLEDGRIDLALAALDHTRPQSIDPALWPALELAVTRLGQAFRLDAVSVREAWDVLELAERLVGVAVPDFYGEYLDARLADAADDDTADVDPARGGGGNRNDESTLLLLSARSRIDARRTSPSRITGSNSTPVSEAEADAPKAACANRKTSLSPSAEEEEEEEEE